MGGRNRYHGIDAYAVKLVHMKSQQLCRQPDFSPNDRLDIEQGLMIELAERLPTHDPARATREAFITWVVLQKIADLIRSQRAKKRRIDVEAISLNDLVFTSEPGSLEERWATLDNEIFQQFTEILFYRICDFTFYTPNFLNKFTHVLLLWNLTLSTFDNYRCFSIFSKYINLPWIKTLIYGYPMGLKN